jgi:hypothetical protein
MDARHRLGKGVGYEMVVFSEKGFKNLGVSS